MSTCTSHKITLLFHKFQTKTLSGLFFFFPSLWRWSFSNYYQLQPTTREPLINMRRETKTYLNFYRCVKKHFQDRPNLSLIYCKRSHFVHRGVEGREVEGSRIRLGTRGIFFSVSRLSSVPVRKGKGHEPRREGGEK